MAKRNREHSGKNNRYRLSPDELEALKEYRAKKDGIEEAAKGFDIDTSNLKHVWLKNKHASGFVTNPNYGVDFNIDEAFEKIAKKCCTTQRKAIKPNDKQYDRACKLVMSDQHIGMNPNPDGKGLFGYEYNATIHANKIEGVYSKVVQRAKLYGVFDKLVIADLGDEQDGYGGYTTRGGHQLEQNMTTSKVFEYCVISNIRLIENLLRSGICKKVIFQTLVNDNHSGTLGNLVAIAVKHVLQRMYDVDLVEVDILEKFFEHRYYGDHAFILTHGKDEKYMKHGLPYILNAKASDLITDYIRHNDIDRNAKYIHVEKGDLHMIGFDDRNNLFDYRNFGSFAPPSAWIQTNYGNSKSSYAIQVIEKKGGDIDHKNCMLDYRKL